MTVCVFVAGGSKVSGVNVLIKQSVIKMWKVFVFGRFEKNVVGETRFCLQSLAEAH